METVILHVMDLRRERDDMKSQLEPVTHCRDCVWFASVESLPEAVWIHEKLMELFDDCLKKREGGCGICRKVTFSRERPVLTNYNGFCHRAECCQCNDIE